MKLARSFACSIVLALVVGVAGAADLSAARPESVGMSSQRLARLTAEMKALSDNGQLSGVVTMVAKDGKVVHFEASGKRDVASGAPMKKDTIFRIYSMTKPVTGVAMMMLFEEGKWQLNDPVSKHIPEFANLKVAKANPASGRASQVAPDHPMTMRELMSHSGGTDLRSLRRHGRRQAYTDVNVIDPNQPMQAMIDKLAKIPLLFQPGERWHYSVSPSTCRDISSRNCRASHFRSSSRSASSIRSG